MKKEIADQWVKALRSGEYAQYRGQLHGFPEDDDKGSFCCLGVLCDLHQQSTGAGYWEGGYYQDESGYNFEVPPESVMAWAGIKAANPQVDPPGLRRPAGDCALTIAELNDNFHWTFNELANLIEEQWESM